MSLINPNDGANWQDRCVVIYPHASAPSELGPIPGRGWNAGFSGEAPHVHDDVGFIRAAVDAVAAMLRPGLRQVGIDRPVFDPDRRHLFGYSNGGMLAYHLVHELPNVFASLWVMAGAIGGRAHEGLTATVFNIPRGRHSVSLFAHHGELDTIVPPGDDEDPTARMQPTWAPLPDPYVATGMTSAESLQYTGSVRTLSAAVTAYRLYNDCGPRPTAALNEPSVDPTSTSRRFTFTHASGAANPEVVVYRDGGMEHGNFSPGGDYLGARDVLDFFHAHPRVEL